MPPSSSSRLHAVWSQGALEHRRMALFPTDWLVKVRVLTGQDGAGHQAATNILAWHLQGAWEPRSTRKSNRDVDEKSRACRGAPGRLSVRTVVRTVEGACMCEAADWMVGVTVVAVGAEAVKKQGGKTRSLPCKVENTEHHEPVRHELEQIVGVKV